jgi:hypothetical protein
LKYKINFIRVKFKRKGNITKIKKTIKKMRIKIEMRKKNKFFIEG